MDKLTIFYLEGCPYCRNAMRAVSELLKEFPDFGEDRIEWIEERRHADEADRYDYYRVPSVFYRGKKLYECSPAHDYAAIKQHLRSAMEAAQN